MKKKIFQKLIIITVVILITISAPLGSYHIGQQNAYAYNKTELMVQIAAAVMGGITSVQAGIANSAIGQSINDNVQSIEDMVDQQVYSMYGYPLFLYSLIAMRADTVDEADKNTFLDGFNDIPELEDVTPEQKEIAWAKAREILSDGIVTPREMLQGTGIAYIYENAIKIAIEDLKNNITDIAPPPPDYQNWENYPDSPLLTSDRPYQVIYEDGFTFLIVSEGKIYVSGSNIICSSKTSVYYYTGGNWDVWSLNKSTYSDGFNNVLETNNNIYDDSSYTSVYLGKTTIDPIGYNQSQFDQDLEDLEDIPVFNSPLNPDFDRTTDPEPFNPPDTSETPDASISVDYDPDNGDTNISQLSDSLGLLGDTFLEGTNEITGEIEQSNTLLDGIREILQGIKSDTGDLAQPADTPVDIPIEGQPDAPNGFGFFKFLNLILLILINILKYIVKFIAFVVLLSQVPASNNLISDPTLIAMLNWWKTNPIPVFNLSIMQIITGYLFLMMAIRIFSIIRGWIEKRSPNFSIGESEKPITSLSDLEKGKTYTYGTGSGSSYLELDGVKFDNLTKKDKDNLLKKYSKQQQKEQNKFRKLK